MNNRRKLLVALGAGALAAPLRSFAQEQAIKVARIGFLGNNPEAEVNHTQAFKEGLRENGWIESKNIIIEYRWSRGNTDRISELVTDLVRLKVDVILAPSSTFVEPAKRVTSTTPIVFAANADPVGLGHVASLRHPGGNITGVTMVLSDMAPKELELLKEMLPGIRRVGVLWNPTTPSHSLALGATEHAAGALALQVRMKETRTAVDYESVFLALSIDRVDAVLDLASPLSLSERGRIAALALNYRFPLMGGSKERAVAGALVSYGADQDALFRISASYVDKILRGAKPGDLPVQQPTKFELVVNMRTAKALGLTIPQSILLRADEVIE